jgi:outer membrane protein assembly factor BamB
MRKFPVLLVLSATIAALVTFAADWPSQSGNPQRDGWAKMEKAFTRENAKSIELLYKYRAENQTKTLEALSSPIVNGNLITYLGFKEMLVFGGSQDNAYSVDADLNRLIWKTHFEYKGDKPPAAPTAVCPGGMTAAMAMPGSSTAGGRGPGGGAPGRAGAAGRGPGAAAGRGPMIPGATPGRGPAIPQPRGLFATGFGRSGVFVAVGSDGTLHPLNTSTGADRIPPVRFVPPNSKLSALNVNEGIIYASTQDGCGGNPNALYALDMSGDDPLKSTLYTFETNGSGAAGLGGTTVVVDSPAVPAQIGPDGNIVPAVPEKFTVYAQFPDGKGDMAGAYNDTVVAFSKDLKPLDYFTPSTAAPAIPKGVSAPGITPVTFQWKGGEVIVAASRTGRVYLLDAKSLGGADHHTPLSQTDAIASADTNFAGNGFQGTFSSWEDTDASGAPGTRWVYASLWGPAASKFGPSNGDAMHGSIVAFKVVDHGGKPALEPAWISRDMMTPAPSVTANGLVFALSSGESNREAKEDGKPYSVAEREKMATHATLYVLDGATGAELYSSGNMATTFSHNSGVTVANRRIYFTTHDNNVFALGFLAEQPQLTGK